MMRQLLVKQSSVVRNGSCSAKFRDCYALLQFDFIRIGGVWMYVSRALNCTTKWICIRQSRSHTVRRNITHKHRVNDIDILHSILELPCTANGWNGWGWMKRKMDRIDHANALLRKCQSYAIQIFFSHIFLLHHLQILYFCEMAHKGSILFEKKQGKKAVQCFDRCRLLGRIDHENPRCNIIYNFYFLLLSIIFSPPISVHFSLWPLIQVFLIKSFARCFYCIQEYWCLLEKKDTIFSLPAAWS